MIDRVIEIVTYAQPEDRVRKIVERARVVDTKREVNNGRWKGIQGMVELLSKGEAGDRGWQVVSGIIKLIMKDEG